MARNPALVVSARIAPSGRSGETVLTAFRPPRGTLLLPLPPDRKPASALVTAISGVAANDAVILLDARRGEDVRYDSEPYRDAIEDSRPDARVLLYDADRVLSFLWHFRDRHDPLTLGHARERRLFDPGVLSGEIPRHRGPGRREERRRATEELRRMLVTLGAALGVRVPLPPLLPAPSGWGAKRLAGAIDACAGLYAGMLWRFGAPVAVETETKNGPALVLAEQGRAV
ncbi:MAG: hypothetical protein ABFS86_00780 [Planctomycetota bacterium]